MNVSSVGNDLWYKIMQSNLNKVNQTTASASEAVQKPSFSSDAQMIYSNSDGDTFELSGAAPPPPPPPGPPPANSADMAGSGQSATTSDSDPIKAFLDKVASGTATEADMTTIQSYLQQLQQVGLNGITDSGRSHRSSKEDELTSFLDKVAGGTATESDLKEMQEYLRQIQRFSVADAAETGKAKRSEQEDLLKDFLDKVAAGKATEADLTAMQATLQQLQQAQYS